MYKRSMLVAVATLMLGACQSPIRVEEVANEVESIVEQEQVEVVQSSAPKATKTTYYDKSLFKLPLDHPYWSTTVLSSDTIEKLKEHYGFSELVANDVVIEENQDSSNQVEGNLASAELVDDSSVTTSNSTTKPNSNSTTSNSTVKPNSNSTTSNNTTKPNQNNQSSKPTPPVVEKPSEPAPQPTPPVVEQPSEPAPQPTPPVVEESKKPVDLLDWNYIKSTLIAKGESLGMSLDTSLNKNNHGYASPWQSSYMPVTNEDVIGYIGYQMEEASSWGVTDFNIEWIPQGDGNVNIYLIR